MGTSAEEAPTDADVPVSMRATVRRFTTVLPLVCLALLPIAALADAATTYEEQVLFVGHAAQRDGSSQRGLLVRRDDGDNFLLTVGRGCSHLTEGRRIALREEMDGGERQAFVREPGGGASCSVLASKAVTLVDDAPPSQPAQIAESGDLVEVVKALQGGLEILGYEPGPVDGEVGPATARALMEYRSDKHHDRGGLDLRFTIWTLGMDVLVLKPYDEGAFAIADTLFRTSEN